MQTESHFRRRYYQSAGQLWADLRRLYALRDAASISPALRERLMLVVTSVNRCSYCAAFHTQAARLSGLMDDEVALLLAGTIRDVPAEELPAVLYARHWAENGGQTNASMYAQLQEYYGMQQARAIERVLRMIWIGNLTGNSWDALLFWLAQWPKKDKTGKNHA